MRRWICLLLAAILALPLTGCRRLSGLLPYGREIEDMELMQTLGVDAAAEGRVAVTASGGSVPGEETSVATAAADTVSAAVLSMQGEGASYLYFGHVGQLLLGEELARRGVGTTLDYILRDVETRLDTALYLVRDGTAWAAITAAGEAGSASDRLEALAEDAGVLAGSMTRTVKDALVDLDAQGATFLPALEADGGLTAAGYGLIKGDALAAWADGDAALGINLLREQVDADVICLSQGGGGSAVLRVVGVSTAVLPVFDGDALTGLSVSCRVEANLAEGEITFRDGAALTELETALAELEARRIQAALTLFQTLDADCLGLLRRAALARPWHKQMLEAASLAGLEVELAVAARIQRGYETAR